MTTLSPTRDVDQPALRALGSWLEDAHYSQRAREAIVRHAELEGTPTGCVYLDREDEATATEVYVDALAEVSMNSPAWDDETMCLDAGMLAEGNHPWPIPTEPDFEDDRSIPPDADLVPPELDPESEDTGEFGPPPGLEPEPFHPSPDDEAAYLAMATGEALPPVCGGSPAPYEPTEADWRDYYQWAAALDARAREARMSDARYGYE